jgi:hypothetical protein
MQFVVSYLRLPLLRPHGVRFLQFLKRYRRLLFLLLALFLVFYWYEVRPIRIQRLCALQAAYDARKLLASKESIAIDPTQKQYYTNLRERNMYLRSDYDSFLKKCLRYYGIND